MISNADVLPFNGIRAIRYHLEQRSRIEKYIAGELQGPLNVPLTCYSNCSLGNWMHGGGSKPGADNQILASLCRSCEAFQEAAAQAVLLKDMGKAEMARAALQTGNVYSEASEKFQSCLAKLHLKSIGESNS